MKKSDVSGLLSSVGINPKLEPKPDHFRLRMYGEDVSDDGLSETEMNISFAQSTNEDTDVLGSLGNDDNDQRDFESQDYEKEEKDDKSLEDSRTGSDSSTKKNTMKSNDDLDDTQELIDENED
ncbi:unnamed protein product [Brachionus calyciflorus]|uniref:Uncharacterized protein n=1 Tax=Brachionus calyciflorus TaxID=104777 RepID=A0A814A6U2_9BILA|nr:unnamed protein product [Brachionus calyciflorus]